MCATGGWPAGRRGAAAGWPTVHMGAWPTDFSQATAANVERSSSGGLHRRLLEVQAQAERERQRDQHGWGPGLDFAPQACAARAMCRNRTSALRRTWRFVAPGRSTHRTLSYVGSIVCWFTPSLDVYRFYPKTPLSLTSFPSPENGADDHTWFLG